MNQTKKMKRLLEAMARVARMERGKLCRMGGRPHYNHQTWQGGRNVVRYVPADEVDGLQEAINGYNLFMKLAEHYADEAIKQTRRERDKLLSRPTKARKRRPTKNTAKRKITHSDF